MKLHFESDLSYQFDAEASRRFVRLSRGRTTAWHGYR